MNEKEKNGIKRRLLNDLFDKAVRDNMWRIHGGREILCYPNVDYGNNGIPKKSLCRVEPSRNLILINSFLFMLFPFDENGDNSTLKRNLIKYTNELKQVDMVEYRSEFVFMIFWGSNSNRIKKSNNEFIKRKYGRVH